MAEELSGHSYHLRHLCRPSSCSRRLFGRGDVLADVQRTIAWSPPHGSSEDSSSQIDSFVEGQIISNPIKSDHGGDSFAFIRIEMAKFSLLVKGKGDRALDDTIMPKGSPGGFDPGASTDPALQHVMMLDPTGLATVAVGLLRYICEVDGEACPTPQ